MSFVKVDFYGTPYYALLRDIRMERSRLYATGAELNVRVREECPECFGDGRCPYCDGDGDRCTACLEPGVCEFCHGRGMVVEYHMMQADLDVAVPLFEQFRQCQQLMRRYGTVRPPSIRDYWRAI